MLEWDCWAKQVDISLSNSKAAEKSQVQVLSINKTHVYISYFYLVGKVFDDIDSIFHVTQKFVFLRDHVTNFDQSNHLKWVFRAENNKHPQNKDSKQYFLVGGQKYPKILST